MNVQNVPILKIALYVFLIIIYMQVGAYKVAHHSQLSLMQIQMEYVGQHSSVHQDISLLTLLNLVSENVLQVFIKILLYRLVIHV
jgi:hypothetical protein